MYLVSPSCSMGPSRAWQAERRMLPCAALLAAQPWLFLLWDFPYVQTVLWLHGLVLPCSCEEKGLVVKAKGTSTSDVICGKCPVPWAGPVQSRDMLLCLPQLSGAGLAWPVGVFGRGGSDHTAGMMPSCSSLSL